MAITGIDTIDGKQIIAAGAVSAKSAEMAYNDENGNPITGYQVAGDYYSASNPSGFITGVDLTPYQLTADMTAYQPAGNYLTTADSANFYTTANESGFISEVPAGTMNESAFSYDASDNITAYNGSAFKAGDELPSGVMVESAVEYNAVNEISGYNGSAIAQYGAEKQWLVHDDTLVHAANSAQYALGINLSAVAQLLGVDETVLWSGNNFVESGTTAYLSDSIYNYNEVKICYNPVYTKGIEYQFEVPGSANSYRFSVLSQDTNVYQTVVSLQLNGTEFYIQRSRGLLFNTTNNTWSTRTVSPTGSFAEGIYKIVGIGRKQ